MLRECPHPAIFHMSHIKFHVSHIRCSRSHISCHVSHVQFKTDLYFLFFFCHAYILGQNTIQYVLLTILELGDCQITLGFQSIRSFHSIQETTAGHLHNQSQQRIALTQLISTQQRSSKEYKYIYF